MNKETLEEAANKYSPEPIYNEGHWEFGDIIESFKAGANWQKEQEVNNAIEFARWLSKNCTVSRNGIQWWYTTKNSYKNVTELYEIWKSQK
jgi:hypothetical protein